MNENKSANCYGYSLTTGC